MPNLTYTPLWTPLSYSNFAQYLPLLKRWIHQSKSKPIHTERLIRSLFTKIFFIISFESILKPNYSQLLTPEFLKKHQLDRSQFPSQISKLPNLINFNSGKVDEQQLLKFFLILIHRIFKYFLEKLNLGLKSELKTLISMSFLKAYELKMLVNLCYQDFEAFKPEFFQYGGIAGLFTEYLSEYNNSLTNVITKKSLQKKRTGSIYTPLWIIRLIHDRIIYHLRNSQREVQMDIGDLSVGYGGFLDTFLNDTMAKKKIFVFHGYDADSYKIDILKLNNTVLQLKGFPSVKTFQLHYQDSLLCPIQQKFDILVGNPPWGAYMNKEKIHQIKDLSEFTVKQYDSWGLFLIRNIISLKENGVCYLVLPETILLNPNYEEIRKFILERTTLLDIYHLGEEVFREVNMPAIILGLQQIKAHQTHQLTIYHDISEVQISDKTNPPHYSSITRSQDDFIHNPNYVFDIFTNNTERSIIEQLDKLPCYKLRQLVNNSRGVEIGKKGEVIQCYHCGVWMPVPEWSLDIHEGGKFVNCTVCNRKIYIDQLKIRDTIILNTVPVTNIPNVPFLLGENIHKFLIRSHSYLILHRRGIKYKSSKIYAQNKILIRKTSKELFATIDYDNHYTIQVIYQFSLNTQFENYPYLLEFILGILSSKIMQFYYSKKYQYANRKSFPHHIQKNLLDLPIPKINFSLRNSKFSELYTKIVFSTMVLMHLTHYHEFASISKSLNTLIANFLKENSDIIHISFQPLVEDAGIEQNLGNIVEHPSKLGDVRQLLDFFQTTLDNSVECLFHSLV